MGCLSNAGKLLN